MKKKKCNHKFTMAWQEVKGKTFKEPRYCEICVKCKERVIKFYEKEKATTF